uniref:Putative reverse transcriptase domain-containing protein n=1 Tax=Tanacetum cinerariifolium TaxID=118510 RepID=A0A6L2KN19_TANCI|nr:putative reverse transcriptase domain-containing protein [Tanacetum cinerariifolium]
MASKITTQDLEISALKARIKHLEDRDRGDNDPSGEDATINGRRLETGEEAGIERSTEKDSDDTEEMANVLTSLDAASVLTSGVQVSVPPVVEVATVSIPPAGEIPTISVPTGSGMVPTATREMEEHMVREDQKRNEQIERDVEIVRIHAEEELQMMIDGLDRNNETVAKYLQEYEQFATEFYIGRRIELNNDLVKYQDNYAKVLKSHAGWKAKHFKGMTLEEIKEKFDPVWKKMQDFVPMGSKEERERFKRKGINLEQESAKKVKFLEEVSEEDLKTIMQLIPVEEVYVEALQGRFESAMGVSERDFEHQAREGIPIEEGTCDRDDKLQTTSGKLFLNEPIEIMERDVKKLKGGRIPLVKVRWNSQKGAEYTREREDQFQRKYPHLFPKPVPSSSVAT